MKLLALVAVVLALLLVAICFVAFLLIRNRLAAPPIQQLPAQPEFPVPTSVIPIAPVTQVELFLPVVVNSLAPPVITVPTSPLWRFLSIDNRDIGTFENAGNPSQRLAARCIDLKRPAPDEGELYTLDESGTLRPQSGSKKWQRFEVIPRD